MSNPLFDALNQSQDFNSFKEKFLQLKKEHGDNFSSQLSIKFIKDALCEETYTTILHKIPHQPQKFIFLCQQIDSDVLAKLLILQDENKQNILHLLIMYGNETALKWLMNKALDCENIRENLCIALEQTTSQNESAHGILVFGFELSKTLENFKLIQQKKIDNWKKFEENIASNHGIIKTSMFNFDPINKQLDELDNNLQSLKNDTQFKQNANKLLKRLQAERNKNYPTILLGLNIKDIIETALPTLDAAAIGMFMRFLNCVLDFIGFRKKQHAQGKTEQAILKQFSLLTQKPQQLDISKTSQNDLIL